MDFHTYLISKKIDESAFKKSDPELYSVWFKEFEQMNPNSFTARKMFSINAVRRKYKLKLESVSKSQETKAPVRPVIKPKIKR
jgi:hypothetical protein